jgi:hypothetical protein
VLVYFVGGIIDNRCACKTYPQTCATSDVAQLPEFPWQMTATPAAAQVFPTTRPRHFCGAVEVQPATALSMEQPAPSTSQFDAPDFPHFVSVSYV